MRAWGDKQAGRAVCLWRAGSAACCSTASRTAWWGPARFTLGRVTGATVLAAPAAHAGVAVEAKAQVAARGTAEHDKVQLKAISYIIQC
jgi:hypothetical protein